MLAWLMAAPSEVGEDVAYLLDGTTSVEGELAMNSSLAAMLWKNLSLWIFQNSRL